MVCAVEKEEGSQPISRPPDCEALMEMRDDRQKGYRNGMGRLGYAGAGAERADCADP